MNAQEALNEIVRLFDQMDLPEDYTKFIELKDGFASLQKLVHQANAKPKTLEELGWEVDVIATDDICYTKKIGEVELNIELTPTHCSVTTFDEEIDVLSTVLPYEVILAIAEKMKELGMTGEQIAKGETK